VSKFIYFPVPEELYDVELFAVAVINEYLLLVVVTVIVSSLVPDIVVLPVNTNVLAALGLYVKLVGVSFVS